MPKTSSVSSVLELRLHRCDEEEANRRNDKAKTPIEVMGAPRPEAGVMATRPATAPEAAPSIEGFLWTICSIIAPAHRSSASGQHRVDKGNGGNTVRIQGSNPR